MPWPKMPVAAAIPTCVGVNRRLPESIATPANAIPTCVGVNRPSVKRKRDDAIPTCVGVNRKSHRKCQSYT